MEPLDNPVWHALTGPQAVFAEGTGLAVRYEPDVAPFAGMPDPMSPDSWRDLAALIGAGAAVVFRAGGIEPPSGWEVAMRLPGFQMVAGTTIGAPDREVVTLGPADADDMLALVSRTRPGPFFRRTVELGTYLGVRDASTGTLVAMAGERMRGRGFAEISAVCTDEAARKRGLATRLVRAVAAGIEARGDSPILHVSADNHGAIRIYEALGFETRFVSDFLAVRPPH